MGDQQKGKKLWDVVKLFVLIIALGVLFLGFVAKRFFWSGNIVPRDKSEVSEPAK